MGAPPEVTDDELLTAVRIHSDPAVTAGDIADRVGLTSQAVNKWLPSLVEDGYIRKKSVGASAAVYWLTDSGEERVMAADSS